jgi:LPS-assembly lipoprotein
MSSSDLRTPRGRHPSTIVRRAGSLAACIAVAAALTACAEGGFRPLYGSLGSSPGAQVKLAQVEVAPVPGRIGQRLRNELIFDTTGGGRPLPPLYRLEIVVAENVTSTIVNQDGDALSQLYTADAQFNLIRLSDKAVVLKGVSFGRAGFERNPSIFANVRAQDDAQNRAAKTIATDMRARLAAYLGAQT